DKGLVIAGDVRVSLANVELLTIRIRLLVCSVDKAEQIGLNWWKFDPNLTYPGSALGGQRPQLGAPPRSQVPAATRAARKSPRRTR
ncbi:MAG: gas vesicle protein, partial [Acidobacteria bacterium]|nr:gas vesicle protein [Acidobacteriota bacterium]